MTAPVYTLGLDVSKAWLDAALRPAGQAWRETNDEAGFARLLARLATLGDPATIRIVLEASGGYERPVHRALTLAGYAVAIVNPQRVREFARSLGRLAKTDRIDTDTIAAFGETIRPRPTPPADPDRTRLAELLAYRQQILDEIAQRTSQAKRYADPSLKRRAEHHLDRLRHDRDNLAAEIAAALQADFAPLARILTSFKGVGPILTATLLAHLPELGSLDDKQIAALVGLAPFARDSGSHRGKRMIRGGRPKVRRVLYVAALAAIRHNPVIRTFQQRLAARHKPGKAVVVACMRKIIIILNAMAKSMTPWTPPQLSA